MSNGEQVAGEIERLKRLAASVEIKFRSDEATRADIEAFEREASVIFGEELYAFWGAGVSEFPLLLNRGCVYDSYPVKVVRREWFGEHTICHDMLMKPTAEQLASLATKNKGLIEIASNAFGDTLSYVVVAGDVRKRGQVVSHDHGSGEYECVGDSLADFLRRSNDCAEANIDAAFFFDDIVKKILHLKGTALLEKLLAQGMDVNYTPRYERESLIERAAKEGRADIIDVLMSCGATPGNALLEVLGSIRYGSKYGAAESLLRGGADPAIRFKDGPTLLSAAAMEGRVKMVRLLVRYGAKDRLPAEEVRMIRLNVEQAPGTLLNRKEILELLEQ